VADVQTVKSLFVSNNLCYYSFSPKTENPIKAVIHHLPHNTTVEDISNGLVSLDFDVTRVSR
jgi:hypothetical protein